MTGAHFALALALWMQGALVFAVTAVLYRQRIPRVRAGEIRVADIALDSSGWPEDAKKAANSYANQFELPVLFFVAGAGLLWLGAGWIEAALAWGFVLSRCVHAFIHLTGNHVIRRFFAFAVGVFLIAALWLALGVRLVLAGLA